MRRILCVDDVQYIGAYSWNDTTKWSTYVRTTYFYTLRIFFGMNSGASRFQLQFLSFSLPHIRIPVRSVLSIAVCRCCILLRFVRAYTQTEGEGARRFLFLFFSLQFVYDSTCEAHAVNTDIHIHIDSATNTCKGYMSSLG